MGVVKTNKHFEKFEDLQVGMLVRTWQSKHIDKKILAIDENAFHVIVGELNDVWSGKRRFYQEEMHHLNLYQIFIDGEWIQYTH